MTAGLSETCSRICMNKTVLDGCQRASRPSWVLIGCEAHHTPPVGFGVSAIALSRWRTGGALGPMCAHTVFERHSSGSRVEAVLTWLGGGHWRELGERHERSTTAVAGVIVLVGAALAWLVATLAVAGSTDWPVWAILPLTLLFGLLVGAVTRAVASGPARGGSIVGRGSVGRGTRSTTRWIRPAFTRTKRWSSRAASTTRRPAARRPASPVSPAPDPKPERRTSFSRIPNGSSTTPWPRVTVKHPGWTQKSPAPNRRWRPHARPQSRTPTAASVPAGSRCTTTRWRARAHS